jgi:Protein of unknown function (DUF402)
VLWRQVVQNRVRWAMPHTLVALNDDRVALYCCPGTRGKRPRRAFVEHEEQLRTGEWEIGDWVWSTNHVLRLTPLCRAHSVDLYWNERWEFRGWYVNFQERLRPWDGGFDSRDQALDITVEPDGSWAWKDEEHLERLTTIGLFTADQARAIRAEGERVLAERPWPTGWEEWRPDLSWQLATLPDGWETL